MAELKTKPTKKSALSYVKSIEDEHKRKDAGVLLKLFTKVTKQKPVMWGESIIGFGKYHYKSTRSTQEGDWPLTGFSARKQNLTLYMMLGFGKYREFLKKLGRHSKSGGSCLYIKKLEDVNLAVLEKLIAKSFEDMKKKYS